VLLQIAAGTHGHVGADLAAICAKAGLQQIREKLDQIDLNDDTVSKQVLDSLLVTQENFAVSTVSTNIFTPPLGGGKDPPN